MQTTQAIGAIKPIMKYNVNWRPSAEAGLARLWVAGVARKRMAAAQARIDKLLADNPLLHGPPVSEGLYALHIPPLYVQYEIDEPKRRVWVVSLSYMP